MHVNDLHAAVQRLLGDKASAVLLAFCLLFAASYVAAYLSLIHFKAQRVFGRRSDS